MDVWGQYLFLVLSGWESCFKGTRLIFGNDHSIDKSDEGYSKENRGLNDVCWTDLLAFDGMGIRSLILMVVFSPVTWN
jgi:hypothetical protein